MKNFTIACLLTFAASVNAQDTIRQKNEFRMIGINFNSYSKSGPSDLYPGGFLINDQTYNSLKRNTGFSVQYSQMNFLKNNGIEYGLGVELMRINSQFTVVFLNDQNYDKIVLSPIRTDVVHLTIPLHYVRRIELDNRLTLVPKIGVDTRVLLNAQWQGRGVYTDSLNNVNYNVGHTTSQRFENGSFQDVFLNGTIGASLFWTTPKGAMFGVQLTVSTQLLKNTLLTSMRDFTYKRNGMLVYDSNNLVDTYYDAEGNLVEETYKAPDFISENRMTNFSLGLSYVFGKNR